MSKEEILQKIDQDVAGLPAREPILTDPKWWDEQPEDYDAHYQLQKRKLEHEQDERQTLNRQWNVLTETTRRSILSDPQARQVLVQAVSLPLTEQLPDQILRQLSAQDSNVERISRSTAKHLGTYLGLPPVPDALLGDTIHGATALRSKDKSTAYLHQLAEDEPYDYDAHAAHIEAEQMMMTQDPGISSAEKRLVGNRYRFARDIKLLGLAAELRDNPAQPEAVDGLMISTLPSGAKLALTEQTFGNNPQLLNPENWQKRTQIKDRVYNVTADGREWILKEQKTNRHTDLKPKGYRTTLDSETECKVGLELNAAGPVQHENITLTWEKPAGYAAFPDGYQFAVFQKEPDIIDGLPLEQLQDEILQRPETYQEEYEQVRAQAKQFAAEKPELLPDNQQLSGEALEQADISFEDFATLKAYHLSLEAVTLLSKTVNERGYTNSDHDGYMFRVQPKDENIGVEIIGMDFEYYQSDPQAAQEALSNQQEANANGGYALEAVYRYAPKQPLTRLASYALLQKQGYALPTSDWR